MQNKKNVIAWTIVAAVVGGMMSVQYHDVLLGGAALWSALPDVAGVHARLEAVTDYNANLEHQIQAIDTKLVRLQNHALKKGGAIAQIQRQIDAAKILSGTSKVVGPGVEVTISDGQMRKADYEQFITHDWDLRSVVNELFAAGAQAVAVNQARITATTGIFCVGPVVNIGGQRLGSPFVIRAIGNPQVLRTALNLPGGVLDVLRGTNRGLAISTPAKESKVVLPAVTSPLTTSQEGGNMSSAITG